VWAGVDSDREQEKLEARKMLENAADLASDQAEAASSRHRLFRGHESPNVFQRAPFVQLDWIAQNKRIGACHPQRPVHVGDPAQRGFVGLRLCFAKTLLDFPKWLREYQL